MHLLTAYKKGMSSHLPPGMVGVTCKTAMPVERGCSLPISAPQAADA